MLIIEHPQQEISAVNSATIGSSNFKTSRKTRFIVHGFTDEGEEGWTADLCQVRTAGKSCL